jgi:reactive chlorine resistance protein C
MKIAGQTGPRGNRNFCSAEAILLRYGLALIFLWIGAMKFTPYEAEGIRPLAKKQSL